MRRPSKHRAFQHKHREQTHKKRVVWLAKQGVSLTHPKLYQHESGLSVYGAYDSWSQESLTERRTHGWKAYPKDFADAPDNALLYWKQKREATLETSALATTLEPHALPLRLLISERLTDHHRERIQETARALATKLDLFPKTSKQRTTMDLDPKSVWKHYEREKKRFETSSQLWQNHLDAISSLEQLFLL